MADKRFDRVDRGREKGRETKRYKKKLIRSSVKRSRSWREIGCLCVCSRFLRQLNGLLGRDSTGLHRYNIAWKGWSTAGTRHWFGRATLHRFILGFPAHDTIISTPFGEQRRFSLCRLLDRSLVPCAVVVVVVVLVAIIVVVAKGCWTQLPFSMT